MHHVVEKPFFKLITDAGTGYLGGDRLHLLEKGPVSTYKVYLGSNLQNKFLGLNLSDCELISCFCRRD